jgi:Flp pilus assembly protein TadG
MRISLTPAILECQEGVAAVEFAICGSVFLAMLFGAIYASILGYASASLHSAVESAARCRSLGTTCTNATTTVSYASSHFHNITGQTPTFVSDSPACGNRVTGTLNYQLNWILASTVVPVSASACYP